MVFRLKERLARKFEEEVQFFKGWQKDKKRVGALMPTSVHAARRMASVINPASGLPVLELGAGTGVITKAILEGGIKPHQLVSVEYSKDFYQRVARLAVALLTPASRARLVMVRRPFDWIGDPSGSRTMATRKTSLVAVLTGTIISQTDRRREILRS